MNAIPIGLGLPIEDPPTKMAPSAIHVALCPSIPVAGGLSSEECLAAPKAVSVTGCSSTAGHGVYHFLSSLLLIKNKAENLANLSSNAPILSIVLIPIK
jgi:hypothetical protein